MIISDLQYIETAENNEVQGGCGYHTAFSDATSTVQAYGQFTDTRSITYAVADGKNGVSLAGSQSKAYASQV